MFDIKITVALKSGAQVQLTQEQKQTFSSFIEDHLNGKKSIRITRKYIRKDWTEEDDNKVRVFAAMYPVKDGIRSKVRGTALRQLADEMGRTYGSVETRIYTLALK